jgi:signal transduction histidine kinase
VSELPRAGGLSGWPLVYVIDDDAGMRETVTEILALAGVTTESFGSGKSVQTALESARPDLALVDQRLPDTTGLVLTARLKSQDPDLSVVLLTGYASAHNAVAAVGLADDYLTKPVLPEDLVRNVMAGIDRTRLRRENRRLVARLQEMNSSLEAAVAERTRELEQAHKRALEDQAAHEQLQVQAERERMENRLHQSQRLEGLGMLAGGVAHDFNNLLCVILNCAAFAAEATGDNEQLREDVGAIIKAAEQAAELTRQLLIFGRRDRVQLKALDLNVVVAEVQSLLTCSIGEQVQLVVHPSASLPPVHADRSQIEAVLVNLVVNARDAMPGGGILTIELGVTHLDHEDPGLLPPLSPGRYVTVSVSDTGIGMDPEVVARIFEPFFTTKPQGHGTGLGLATVHGIVTGAGGALSVRSAPGAGTTIRTFFPAAEELASADPATAVTPGPGGRGETILVVEDEPAVLRVVTRILQRNEYSVMAATNGTQALALAADHEFDLLLTDVVMPGISGLELADRVKQTHPRAAVLLMSGYSPDLAGPGHAFRPDLPLVQKPVTERTLLEAIRAAIATPRGVPESDGPPKRLGEGRALTRSFRGPGSPTRAPSPARSIPPVKGAGT